MYRIGIGDVEFPMKIEFPEEVFGDEENILWREAKKIKEHYEILHQILCYSTWEGIVRLES